MNEGEIVFGLDRPMEKRVNLFAQKTIQNIEKKSKILSSSVMKISDVSNMR